MQTHTSTKIDIPLEENNGAVNIKNYNNKLIENSYKIHSRSGSLYRHRHAFLLLMELSPETKEDPNVIHSFACLLIYTGN